MALTPEEEYLRQLNQTPEEQVLDRFRTPEERYLAQGDVQSKMRAPVKQSVYDVTLGALQYGSAESAGLLAKGIPFVGNKGPLAAFASSMDRFKKDHPEYAPQDVNSAWDLLRNPGALSSRVFSGGPQMLAGIAALEFGGPAGLPLAAGLAYSIESRRAYETALSSGASVDEAETAGRRTGALNAAFEVLQSRRILNFAEGKQGLLARLTEGRADKMMRALKLSPDAVGAVTSAAMYNVMQGAATDGIANLTYGKDVKEGFFDRRMQEAVTGATTAGIIGPITKYFKTQVPMPDGTTKNVTVDAYDRDSFHNYLVEQHGWDPEAARHHSELVDSIARTWSNRNDQPIEAFYGKFVTGPTESMGENLLSASDPVPKLFLDKDPKVAIRGLVQIVEPMLSPTDRKTIADAGMTTTDQVSKGFMQYLNDGHAPVPELVEPFAVIKDTVKEMYRTAKDTSDQPTTPMPSELRSAFDRVLSIDTDQIAEARRRLYTAEEDLLKVKQAPQTQQIGQPEPGQLFRMGKTDVEQQQDVVQSMYEDLRKLQLGRELPQRDSAVARRAQFQEVMRNQLRLETPAQRITRTGFERATDWFSSLVDFSAPLKKYTWGRKALDMLSDVISHQRSIQGEYYEQNWSAYSALDKVDRNWLSKVDEDQAKATGIRLDNFTRLIESVGVPNPIEKAPTTNLELYRNQVRKIMVDLGNRAEREGMLVRMGDGDLVPYRQPKELRMLRFLTDDARMALEKRSGEVYDAIREAVKKGDPEADLSGVEKVLDDYAKGISIKESGPLTDARTIKVMPSEVQTASGAIVKVLHTEPFTFLERAVRVQAYQLGWNRVMGTSDIENVTTKQMRKFLENMKAQPIYNAEVLRQRINDRTGVEIPSNVTDLAGLERVAKDAGIAIGPRRKQYINSLNELTVDNFNQQNIGHLTEFAKEVGGVNPDAPPVQVLNEVKARVAEKPIDVVDALSKGLAAEGGDVTRLKNAIRLSQGIPIYRTHYGFLERDPVIRGAKLVSGFLGSIQTSMSVIANIPQTLVQVPQMVGMQRYLDAVGAVMSDWRNTKNVNQALGAIGDTHQAFGLERGYVLEGIARNIRQAAQYATGMKWISDVNNVVAGEAFRRMALDWRAQPSEFTPNDVTLAKHLSLNDAQIKEIQSGKMSDATFAKIVQNGVAKTQYVTESAHLRGSLENHPLARMIFAYNSYSSGTARSTMEMYKGWKEALSSGDGGKILNMTQRSALLLGGSLGAGMMGEMFRNVIRGDVSREQKQTDLERGIGALLQIQLLGPTQRLFDSFQYSKGSSSNYITGLMPQVRAVQDLLSIGYNAVMQATGSQDRMGANAGFDLWTQAGRALETHTPVLKAALRWREQVAYPDVPVYNEVRANVGKWRGDVMPKPKQQGDSLVNQQYDEVWRWVVRNDSEMAMKSAQQYYQDQIAERREDPEQAVLKGITMDSARIGLRASLMSRRPIDLSIAPMMQYLKQLPDDQKQKYLGTQKKYVKLVNQIAPSNS